MPEGQASWFAVFTKPRQERIAETHLGRQGFECFLPLALNPYQKRTTRQPRIEPLFPRYLFLRAIPEQHSLAPVRSTRGVLQLVRFGQLLVAVPRLVIDALHARQDEAGLVRLDPVPATPGDRVRVFDGPLAGVKGLFQASNGEQRALLLIEMMGRQATVEVDRLWLKKTA